MNGRVSEMNRVRCTKAASILSELIWPGQSKDRVGGQPEAHAAKPQTTAKLPRFMTLTLVAYLQQVAFGDCGHMLQGVCYRHRGVLYLRLWGHAGIQKP